MAAFDSRGRVAPKPAAFHERRVYAVSLRKPGAHRLRAARGQCLVGRRGPHAVGVALDGERPIRVTGERRGHLREGAVRGRIDESAVEGEVHTGQLHPAGQAASCRLKPRQAQRPGSVAASRRAYREVDLRHLEHIARLRHSQQQRVRAVGKDPDVHRGAARAVGELAPAGASRAP